MFHQHAAALLLAGLCLTPCLASAQTPRGPEIRVDPQAAPTRWSPQVATSSTGDFVVAWQSGHPNFPGQTSRVWLRRFRADGTPKGIPFRASNSKADEMLPKVAMAADGSFVAVWQGGTNTESSVFGRRFTAAGQPVGGRFILSANTEGSQSEPAVALLPGGGFVATWTSGPFPFASKQSDVFVRRFGADGSPLGPEIQVNTTTFNEQGASQVKADGHGSFLVGWLNFGGEGTFYDVYARRFAADGSPLSDEIQVNTGDTVPTSQSEFAMAVRESGEAVFVWTDNGADSGLDDEVGILGQRLAADGSLLGPIFHVNAGTAGFQDEPAITLAPVGFFVAWWSFASGPSPAPRVLGRRFFGDGTPRGGDVRLDLSSGSKGQPALALSTSSGKGAVAWTSGLTGEQGVFARRLVQPLP
jgi:hypothetical protein